MSDEKTLTVVEELLGTYELMRRLDFLPDDVFVVVGTRYVSVKLMGDDGRDFDLTVAALRPEEEKLTSESWTQAANEWNGPMSDEERSRIYENSRAFANWPAILTNMRQVRFQPKGGWSPEVEALSMVVDGTLPDILAPESTTSKKPS